MLPKTAQPDQQPARQQELENQHWHELELYLEDRRKRDDEREEWDRCRPRLVKMTIRQSDGSIED